MIQWLFRPTMVRYLHHRRSKPEDIVFPLSAIFVRISASSRLYIKWSVCHRYPRRSSNLTGWMWSWKKSLRFSRRIWKTTHPFSISWIKHSVRFVIGTEIHLTGEPCWRSVTCLRQISMLTKMANPKLKKNLPRPIIGMTIRAFTISTNSIRCPAIPSTIW